MPAASKASPRGELKPRLRNVLCTPAEVILMIRLAVASAAKRLPEGSKATPLGSRVRLENGEAIPFVTFTTRGAAETYKSPAAACVTDVADNTQVAVRAAVINRGFFIIA